jgi:hypothetical protein
MAAQLGIQQCDEALALIELRSNALEAAEATCACFELGLQRAKTWCKRARSALAEIHVNRYSQCVVDLTALAMKVEKHTPKFDHFLNDTTCSVGLVRRHLLQHPAKDNLGKEAVCLFKAMLQLASVAHAFGLRRPQENPSHKDAVEHADFVYKSAKRAVTCIVAANALLNFGVVEFAQEGAKLVEQRGAELPKALLNALQAKLKEQRARPGPAARERSKGDD